MNPLLVTTLQKLSVHYKSQDIEEIAINQPYEIWIKSRGSSWLARHDEALSESYLLLVCQLIANVTGQMFHPVRLPLLYATLPEGHRFTAVAGSAVRYDMRDIRGIAINIRIFDKNQKISLDRYGLLSGKSLASVPLRHGQIRYAPSPLEDLLGAVYHREAILISGATSTGKTSFLNAIVEHLPEDSRILTVEDTREVMIPHPNRVHLLVSRTEGIGGLNFTQIVDAVVRMTPDVIICGEIGISNATGVFRLMTTGHTNFMATIHASSPEGAIKAFYQNLVQSNPGIDAEAALQIIAAAFGRIVQIDRQGNQRLVTSVEIPGLLPEIKQKVVS